MTDEPIDLDAVRRRLERALDYINEQCMDGVCDPHKTRRAAYIVLVNDVPKLTAELASLRASVQTDSSGKWEYGVRVAQPWRDDEHRNDDEWHGTEANARRWQTTPRQGPCTLTLIRRRPASPAGPIELVGASSSPEETP